MFTWICPQCGREVPPAYDECPDCAAKQKGQAAAQQPATPPAAATAPPVPQAAEPRWPRAVAPPPTGVAIPAWALSILFAVGFLAVGAGAYYGIRHFTNPGAAASSPPALENPPAAGKGAATSSLQKYVEVVGVRLTEEPRKKPEVRFVVVNHSGAEISDLVANVNLWARTAKSDEEAVGSFSFKLPSLGPYESKELSAPLTTKLRVYELPDWQNLVADIQITSPK